MAKITEQLEKIQTDLKSEHYGVWLEPKLHKETVNVMQRNGYKNKSEYLRNAIRNYNEKLNNGY